MVFNCPMQRSYLGSHGVVVSGSSEGAPQLGDFPGGFVNGNNITKKCV